MFYKVSITLFIANLLVNSIGAKDFDPDLADICLNTIKGQYIFTQDFSHTTAMKIEKNDSVLRVGLHFTPTSHYNEAHLTIAKKSRMLNALEDEILRRAGYKQKEFTVAERVAIYGIPAPSDKEDKAHKLLTDIKSRATLKQKHQDYEIREIVMNYLTELEQKVTIPFNLRPEWGKVSLVVERFPDTKSYFTARKTSSTSNILFSNTPSPLFTPESGEQYIKPFPTNYLELRLDIGSWIIQILTDEMIKGKNRIEKATLDKKMDTDKTPEHMYM